MGRILVGKCRKCSNGTETLLFGSGRCDNNEVCNYPALDRARRKVVRANIMEKEAELRINPNLIFYDDDSLHSPESASCEVFYTWGDYKLFCSGNYCPKCKEFSLIFNSIGLYD